MQEKIDGKYRQPVECTCERENTLFEKLMNNKDAFRDPFYKEVDGIHIVLQGAVDILHPGQRKLIHSLGALESFGESLTLSQPSFEYYGDLYACLDPKNTNQGLCDPEEQCVITAYMRHERVMEAIPVTEVQLLKEKQVVIRNIEKLAPLVSRLYQVPIEDVFKI